MRMPEDLRRILVQAHQARLSPGSPYASDPRLYYVQPEDIDDGNTYNVPGPSLNPPATSLIPENHRNTPYNLLAPFDRFLPPWMTRRFDRNFYDYDLVERPNPRLPTLNEPNFRMLARSPIKNV